MDRCFHFSMCVYANGTTGSQDNSVFIWEMASFPPCLYSFTIPAMRVPISPQPCQHWLSDSDSSYPRHEEVSDTVFCFVLFFHCTGSPLRHTGASLVGVRGLSHPMARGILVPWPGIEPTSPALEGGFLTTGPCHRSPWHGFWSVFFQWLMMSSIFLCTYWLFVYLPWRNVYSNPLPFKNWF